MRDEAQKILNEIGIETGGANVQFAVDPKTKERVVIEMNPRVSRSSALASKATGFPIAKVAAKLAVGYTLDELKNDITGGATPASFEPSIDYVVTKVPRFAFEKFPMANDRLTTQMKSVGEVMAIGRSFQESMQKALRGLEVSVYGFDEVDTGREDLNRELASAGPQRIWYVAQAFREGYSLQQVFDLTKIDPWFLVQIEEIVTIEGWMRSQNLADLDAAALRGLKRKGFSDRRIGTLVNASGETAVREYKKGQEVEAIVLAVDVERERISLGIKQLDSDPFTTFVSINDKGQVVTGKVKTVDPKGAEIDLGDDIVGYLRASEISRDRVEDARNVLKEGDEVTAVVVNVDRKTRNIQLSIKAKDMADQNEAMANLNQNTGNAGTTNLGALLKAKLDSNN
jgi:predicted RNA-binding protein with RPS1 domain